MNIQEREHTIEQLKETVGELLESRRQINNRIDELTVIIRFYTKRDKPSLKVVVGGMELDMRNPGGRQ